MRNQYDPNIFILIISSHISTIARLCHGGSYVVGVKRNHSFFHEKFRYPGAMVHIVHVRVPTYSSGTQEKHTVRETMIAAYLTRMFDGRQDVTKCGCSDSMVETYIVSIVTCVSTQER